MSASLKNVLFILFVLYYSHNTSDAQNIDEGVINISLSNFKPLNQSMQVFDIIHDIYPEQQYIISVNDIPDKYIDFFLIQVHSFGQIISLSNDKEYVLGSYINGTNVGLVQLVNGANTYNFYLKNDKNAANYTIYVAVLPYREAPIPGGCNMEFTTEIAPYQILKATDAVITVDAQPASFKHFRCENEVVQHELYQMYLQEYEFSKDAYFEGVRKMLTVENITVYGTKVSKPLFRFLRQLYNVYKGTGSVYTIVATVNGSKSAYIPAVSYGCDINFLESCLSLTSVGAKVVGIVMLLIGCFLCFNGHKFFKLEIFFLQWVTFGFVIFVVLTLFADLNETSMFWISTALGLVFSFWLLYIGLYCGIMFSFIILPMFLLAYTVACIFYYAGLNDLMIDDITYWGFFSSIVLLSLTILMGFGETANILASAIIGSLFALQYFDCILNLSNIRYIFINIYRRITAENYGSALINAPYQAGDVCATVLWMIMVLVGILDQWKRRARERSLQTSEQPPSERTPLLSPADQIIPIHTPDA